MHSKQGFEMHLACLLMDILMNVLVSNWSLSHFCVLSADGNGTHVANIVPTAMVDELILRKEAANEELMRLTSAPNRTDVVVKVDRHPPAEIIPAGPALCEIRL